MKTQTAVPEVLDYPKSSVNNIDIRIDKKEYEILTEDCTCIIDEVEFVKIIDLETNMPLPVVATPQPTTTATPRKGMPKFLSRLLNRLSVLPLTLPLCLVLVLGVGNVWGQAPTNGGFENVNATSWSGGTVGTTSPRTGAYNLSYSTTSTSNVVRTNSSTISIPNNNYAHVLGWAVGNNSNARASVGGTLDGTAASAPIATIGTTLTRLKYSVQNTLGGAKDFSCRINIRSTVSGTSTTVTWDDVFMYTHTSSTPDETKPTAATSFTNGSITSSSIAFSWTNGSDAATGIQNTIILRTTNTSAAAPSLNDQGVYSVAGGTSGPNTIGGWTVISVSVASGSTSYTDNTVAAGTSYKYAVIHRDLAYNYSTALVSGTITSSSPTTVPAAPTITSITPGNQQLSVAFTAGSDGGSAITTYKYSTNGGTNWQTRSAGTTSSPLVISTLSTDGSTALTNGVSYNVQIRAVNAVGDGTATASTAATPRTTPSAPTITGITPGNEQLSVAFTAGSDGGSSITTYKYSTNGGANWQTRSAGTTASPLVISTLSTDGTTALTNGVSYDIQIRAVNVAGDGTASSTTSATPVAPVSPTLNAVTLSSSLTSTYGTASTGVSFTANGSNLTAENITVTAQSGYEVSTSSGSGYGTSVSVASGTTVYVRFASTLSVGNYNNQVAVVLSGGGASSNANVTTSSSGNTVSKATPTIISSPTASAITYGQTLASSILLGGSASVPGSFAFTTPSTAPNGGTASQSVTFTPTDNANYNTTTTNVNVAVNQANQTITFGALANKINTDAPFSLTATASSGLTVSYSSSNTSVATAAGSMVTIVGAGQTTITASQAGNGNYNAAANVDRTLTVTQAPVTIFTENIGSPSGTTSITSHTFQNSSTLTFSNGGATNSSDIRMTNASSGYSGASGNGNVFFTSTSGSYGFAIEGINVSTYTNLEVRFAYRKESATVLPDLILDYWNGSSYVNVPFTFNEAANAAVAWYMVNWISLPVGAQISTLRLRWVKAGTQSVRLDDISLRGIINTSPLILISQNTMSGFSQNSSTPSAEQSYTVSGDNLTNDVTITPPTGFEISTATGGSFSATNPITLTASGGNLVGEPVTIYVRQSASSLGVVSGNITHSSTGANSPNVAVSGIRTGSYYSKSSGNLEEVGTWGINTDGSGSSPSNFSTDGIIYEIRNRATATIGANWTISGTASKVLVGDGTNSTDFTIPSTFTLTGTIDVSNAGELTIENTTSPTIGTVADNGTVEYKNVAFTLSTATTYKNLKLSGSGTKTFPGGTTNITGNLTLENTSIDGGSGPFSTILLGGNLTYIGTVTPPADANSITLSTNGTAGGTQTITGAGNTLRWFRITTTTANTILLSTSGGTSNLLVGNSSGGGLTLVDGSVLNMNGNDLTLFSSLGTSTAFILNSTASISTTTSTDLMIERTGNGNLGTLRFTSGSNTIGNLTLKHIGSTNNLLYLGSALAINGTLILTNGVLSVGANSLSINGSLNRTSGFIDASNASASVVFAGSSSQNIPASTFTGNINNLTLNNSAGLSLNQDISVVNSLTLTSGKLTLGSNHLTLGLNATIGGTPSASNMIIASGDGELRKRFSAANLDAFTFPVGTGTSYTPVVLDFNSGTFGTDAYMRVRVKNQKSSFLNSNVTTYLNRNWIVEPFDITGYSYKVQLHYVDADFVSDGSLAEGNLLPIKISSGQWYQPTDGSFNNAEEQGFAGVFANSNFLEWDGLTTFSEFGGAGGSNQPLPVELLSFNAACVEDQNILSWQTATEQNSSHFDIEKSRDGQSWNVIGQQIAAGNSTDLLSYQFVDNEKNNSTVYYRLNQVDVDGKNEYFGPVALDCDKNYFEATTLPNPSNGNFWVKIQSNEGSSAEFKLLDIKGNVLLTNVITIQEGINVYPITHVLQTGMYFIHVQNSKDQKITVLKHLQN